MQSKIVCPRKENSNVYESDFMKKIKVILASSSPRRREVLETLAIPFTVLTPNADEHVSDEVSPEEFVRIVSARKGEAACAALTPEDGTLVVSCDTVVVYNGLVIGKPKDATHAFLTLDMLSDSWHAVLSGLTLTYFDGGARTVSDVCRTDVKFRALDEREIDAYVKSGEPMGKAGSYAIQSKGASLVERIEGDYYNIVGFPVSLFFRMLKEEFEILPTDLIDY